MFRIVLYFLFFIISLFLPGRRYGSGYNTYGSLRGAFRAYNDYEDQSIDFNTSESISSRINAFLRRRTALKTAKRFVNTTGNRINLKNRNVILAFDTKQKIFKLTDKHLKGRYLTVVWFEQTEYEPNYSNNIFEATFDNICKSFNEKASYSGIANVLRNNFKVEERLPKPIESQEETYTVQSEEGSMPTIEANKKLDINSASTEEIAALPGINIVTAKKAVKFREEHKGFIEVEQFYAEMGIKPHFQSKLNELICTEKYNPPKNPKPQNNERIIDF